MDGATWYMLIAEQRESLVYRKECSSETLGAVVEDFREKADLTEVGAKEERMG